jgi:glycosyltransferase involved in cell wall biosynthesis
MMKLSIALCTYNGGQYLQEQLDSVDAQTRAPDELVVCDDLSTDQTREILESYAARSSFPVRLCFNEQNIGSTRNFARAIELCEGDLIALSDQDDIWHPEKLERLEATFVSSPNLGLVFTNAELVDDASRPLGQRLWQFTLNENERGLIEAGRAFDVLLSRNVVTGATMAFRSVFTRLILPIPTDLYLIHDEWIALIISTVADLAALDEPLIKYRQHLGQQLGINTLSEYRQEKSRLKVLRETRARYYAGEIHKLETVRERLPVAYDAINDTRRTSLISQIDGLVAHYRVRGRLPERRWHRLPIVYEEFLTRRYHVYSKGIFSAAIDLLR